MSRLGGIYSCKCGQLYYCPRSLLRHLEETGHDRKVSQPMLARRALQLIEHDE